MCYTMSHRVHVVLFLADIFLHVLTAHELYCFLQGRYHQAKVSTQDRSARVLAAVEGLERDLELLCVTGVEDKLQTDVRPTLELLKNAGIKVDIYLLQSLL